MKCRKIELNKNSRNKVLIQVKKDEVNLKKSKNDERLFKFVEKKHLGGKIIIKGGSLPAEIYK